MNLDSTKLRNRAMKAAFRSIAGARHKTTKVNFYQRPLARNCGYTQIVMRHALPPRLLVKNEPSAQELSITIKLRSL